MRLTKTEIFTMLSILVPYFLVLFFFRHTSIFIYYGLLGFSAFFIIGCLTILLMTKPTKIRKGYYFIIAIFGVSMFLTYENVLINTADKLFFLIHKAKMTETVVAIEKTRYRSQPIEIPKLYFAAVDTLESGEVIFTLDGMLDNCVGIAYSKENYNPGYTNCGRIIEWRKLDDHWYFWYTT